MSASMPDDLNALVAKCDDLAARIVRVAQPKHTVGELHELIALCYRLCLLADADRLTMARVRAIATVRARAGTNRTYVDRASGPAICVARAIFPPGRTHSDRASVYRYAAAMETGLRQGMTERDFRQSLVEAGINGLSRHSGYSNKGAQAVRLKQLHLTDYLAIPEGVFTLRLERMSDGRFLIHEGDK